MIGSMFRAGWPFSVRKAMTPSESVAIVSSQIMSVKFSIPNTSFAVLFRREAMAHEAGRLHAAAGHGGQFAEGHAGGRHTCVLTVDYDHAVDLGHDAADAFEAAAAGHGILDQRIQCDVLHRAVGRIGDHLVYCLVGAKALVDKSQDTAPHRPRRSGVTTQQCAGAKLWHRMQV